MAHLHEVRDTDKHFVIDPTTRAITNNSGKNVLMQGDHNSEIYTFEIPKMVEGHELLFIYGDSPGPYRNICSPESFFFTTAENVI